jgi:hypothetical protein
MEKHDNLVAEKYFHWILDISGLEHRGACHFLLDTTEDQRGTSREGMEHAGSSHTGRKPQPKPTNNLQKTEMTDWLNCIVNAWCILIEKETHHHQAKSGHCLTEANKTLKKLDITTNHACYPMF